MKRIVKKIVFMLSIIIILPLYIFYRCIQFINHSEKTFQGFSQLISLFPGTSGEYLRKAFYMMSLQKCSENCCISFGVLFSHSTSSIEEGVYIGTYCTLGDVSIGKDVLLGSNVDIINGTKQHYFTHIDIPIREQGGEFPRISIGEDTWIGNGALIAANVGKKCIIGAHSVITSDVEDYSIMVGNPAKKIKDRRPQNKEAFSNRLNTGKNL